MSLARQQLMGGPGQPSGRVPPPPPMMMNPPPSIMQLLDQLSTEQLEKLLTDQEAFKQFVIKNVSELPAAKALHDIQSRNRALAQENLDMAADIEEARNHVAVVKSSEFTGTRNTFAELQARQAAVLDTLSPGVILAALAKDTEQADEHSGKLMDSYLSGQITLEAFVEQYMAQRIAFHQLDLRRQVAEYSLAGNML